MSSRAITAARLLAGLAHPDFSLIRREWQAASKKLATEISVDAVRRGLQVFQLSAAFGGWRIAIVDCRRGPESQQRQRFAQDG